jgi:hypothetical protein
MLKQVMDDNPYQSSHFAWLNICIERMGYKNLIHLDSVLREKPRDKVSTCYIDYIPETLVKNVPRYLENGRCSLCSGFFTGRKEYLYEFCNRVEEKFVYFMHLGYGHADEQLFSAVYFNKQDLFDLYYGDYCSMITNYRKAYDTIEMPLRNIAVKSFKAADWVTCFNACNFLWMTLTDKAASMEKKDSHSLLTMFMASAYQLGKDRIDILKENGALQAFYSMM